MSVGGTTVIARTQTLAQQKKQRFARGQNFTSP
jgi:hypothetical protein